MKTYKDYSDYFENLAIQHSLIPHTVNNKKAFSRINIEEAITGFRTAISEKSIIMILTNYLYRVIEGGGNDRMKAIDMSFFIVGYHKPNDFDAETTVRNQCEKIVDDIISRIRFESETQTADSNSFWYNSQSRIKDWVVNPVSNVGDINNAGYQVSFSFHVPFNSCVDTNIWQDLSPTSVAPKNWTT